MKERPKMLTAPKFSSLKKHETLSKNFAINKKRRHFRLQRRQFRVATNWLVNAIWCQIANTNNPLILCPTENTLVRWIYRTIWLCHNHQARRLHTSLIELNPACHDVIFSPLDNSLSDGKHACLKKHGTLSKNFAINKKRKDTSDFNGDNFELLQIDWSMPYDVKLPTPTIR